MLYVGMPLWHECDCLEALGVFMQVPMQTLTAGSFQGFFRNGTNSRYKSEIKSLKKNIEI